MTGVRYNTDGKGHKTEVIIDLKKHGQLVEDILDILLMEERKNEESIPFEDFMQQLSAGSKTGESLLKKPLRFGMMKGTFIVSDDFDEPLDLI